MSEQLPSLESLRCFAEAARTLNFSAAARAVALTPAALGQRIKQLEELLNVRLFHRTTRAVTLTQDGHALLAQAHKTLEAAVGCLRLGEAKGPPAMEVTIGTRYELGLSWIVPMLPELRRAREGLTIHAYFGSGPDLLHRVHALQIDCAVTSTVLTDPKLEGARLHEERYALVAAPRLLTRRPFARAGDATSHTLIDLTPGLPLFHYLREAPAAAELRFGALRYMGTIAAIRALVVRGEGVAVLPEYFVAPDLKASRLVRLLPRAAMLADAFRLVFRTDDPRRGLFEGLAEVMRATPLR